MKYIINKIYTTELLWPLKEKALLPVRRNKDSFANEIKSTFGMYAKEVVNAILRFKTTESR